MTDLDTIMAAIRFVETGSYDGNYEMIKLSPQGDRLVGAYGFLEQNWQGLANASGIGGAPWQSNMAQDWVAGHVLAFLARRYGNWQMASAAWYGGIESGDKLATRGYQGVESIQNQLIGDYVRNVIGAVENAPMDFPRVAPEISVAPSGWIQPVAGDNEWSPGGFLYRRTASQIAAGKSPIHEGIDIFATRGTPVVSPVAGEIVAAGYGNVAGYYVKIKGNDGITYYMAHLASDPKVSKGQTVRAGHHVGFVGNSGNAKGTSPHLHFTMRNDAGQLVNPSNYLSSADLGGGSFPGLETQHVHGDQPDPATNNLTMMVDAYSAAAAGGERIDYRTLKTGVEPQEEQPTAPDPRVAVPGQPGQGGILE